MVTHQQRNYYKPINYMQ